MPAPVFHMAEAIGNTSAFIRVVPILDRARLETELFEGPLSLD